MGDFLYFGNHMKPFAINSYIFLPLLLTLSLSITGCDQIKSKLTSFVSEPTPTEMSKKIDKLVQDKAYQKAISEGEAYLQKKQDPDGIVSESMVKAYMASGDTAGMIEHLNKYKVGSSSGLMDSSTQSIDSKKINQDPNPPESEVRAGNASVTQTKQGTIVRAGEAVVVIPK